MSTPELSQPENTPVSPEHREYEDIAWGFRALREQAGYSQQAFAEAAGTTQSAVSEAERGKVELRLTTLAYWAGRVGRRVLVAFGEKPPDDDRTLVLARASKAQAPKAYSDTTLSYPSPAAMTVRRRRQPPSGQPAYSGCPSVPLDRSDVIVERRWPQRPLTESLAAYLQDQVQE